MTEKTNLTAGLLLLLWSCLGVACSSAGDDDDTGDDDDSSISDDDDSSNSDDDDSPCRVVEGAVDASPEVPAPSPIQAGELYVAPLTGTDAEGFPLDSSTLQLLGGFSVVSSYPGYYQTCLFPGDYILVATVDTDGDGASCSAGDYFGATSVAIESGAEPYYSPEIVLSELLGVRTCGG